MIPEILLLPSLTDYLVFILPTEPSASGSAMVGGIVAAIVILVFALLIIGAVILIVVR